MGFQMPAFEVLAHLRVGRTSIVLIGDGGMPVLAHWGADLGSDAIDASAFDRPVVNGGLDLDPPVGLIAESARGWFGRPGLAGNRPDGSDFAPRFTLVSSEQIGTRYEAHLTDKVAELTARIIVELTATEVARFSASVKNTSEEPYALQALRLSLPVLPSAVEVATIGGRHAYEFVEQRTPWVQNCIAVENRHGKTSHERLGVVFAGSSEFSEHSGEVWGCHIGWSGNYELVCDGVTDARKVIQAGEILLPGEVRLGPGESYQSPVVYGSYSDSGRNRVSQNFHNYLRSRPGHPTLPRPVHLNTWEAVYFDHDIEKLKALAESAASIGIERFVLDDGWFGGRRDDTRGLGDWWVSPDVWPDGLDPIIEHVNALGMEFGIWLEPEMVNPDSDLYRKHPDWALVDQRYPHVLGRNQLVLDVSRPEVEHYLYTQIDDLLQNHNIAYIKWDHNRDLVSPTSSGRAGVHSQTLAVYRLLDRLRDAHPDVEIETCASGGGRADFGILERTDRVWTSDSIDALDRHSIQRGFSLLFPLELMGTHVGAPVSHTTGRQHRLSFRGASSLLGSFGVEWNLLEATPADLELLADLIALHKEHRALLHQGDALRVDHADPTIEIAGVLSPDRSEALVGVTRLASGPSHHTPPIRLPGLIDDEDYAIRHVARVNDRLSFTRRAPAWLGTGLSMTGRQLSAAGFHIPTLDPESSLFIHVVSEGGGTERDPAHHQNTEPTEAE